LTPPKQQALDRPAQMKTPAGVRCTGGSWLIADAGFTRDASIDKCGRLKSGYRFNPLR